MLEDKKEIVEEIKTVTKNIVMIQRTLPFFFFFLLRGSPLLVLKMLPPKIKKMVAADKVNLAA